MRKTILTIAAVGLLGLSTVASVFAAVTTEGLELLAPLATAVKTACVAEGDACEEAKNAYYGLLNNPDFIAQYGKATPAEALALLTTGPGALTTDQLVAAQLTVEEITPRIASDS